MQILGDDAVKFWDRRGVRRAAVIRRISILSLIVGDASSWLGIRWTEDATLDGGNTADGATKIVGSPASMMVHMIYNIVPYQLVECEWVSDKFIPLRLQR